MASLSALTGAIQRFHPESSQNLSDSELLGRYVERRDQDAFAKLVERYGSLVLGVARRQLADSHDAEDVFQATFLALARMASRQRKRTSLANLLYTIALRQSRKLRIGCERRESRERFALPQPRNSRDPLEEVTGRELLQIIDEEIAALPDRFRLPVLLCCIQGLSREEAAKRLGWSEGSVKGRLERGRERLAARLAARGLGPTAFVVAPLAAIAVPSHLIARTVAVATGARADVPSAIAALAAAGTPRKSLLLFSLVGCLLVAGLSGWAFAITGEKQAEIPPASSSVVLNHTYLISAPARDDPKPGEMREFEIAQGVKMSFCWIPKGEAQLGSPEDEREFIFEHFNKGQRSVPDVPEGLDPKYLETESETARGKFRTQGFWLGKYTVTQEEWKAVMGKNPSSFRLDDDPVIKDLLQKDKITDTSRFPVEWVNWYDCQVFLTKLNKREGAQKAFGKKGEFVLPHENEWEYACRGGEGNKRAFYWGDKLDGNQANCIGDLPYGTETRGPFFRRICAVDDTNKGKYEKHPWGLFHMSGNVWQWCENKYEETKADRVLRGGSWNVYPYDCRSAHREKYPPSARNSNYGGLRVCYRSD